MQSMVSRLDGQGHRALLVSSSTMDVTQLTLSSLSTATTMQCTSILIGLTSCWICQEQYVHFSTLFFELFCLICNDDVHRRLSTLHSGKSSIRTLYERTSMGCLAWLNVSVALRLVWLALFCSPKYYDYLHSYLRAYWWSSLKLDNIRCLPWC